MIYLDHAATTPVPRAVADAMYTVLTEEYGNPSSQYALGHEMQGRVAAWRKTIAAALGCGENQLFFTSCGTEADNWAISAAAWQNRHVGRHIVTCTVEHSAVLEPCRWLEQQGFAVTYLAPDSGGNLTAQQVLDAVRPDTALVSIMLVNNELGNVYPIGEIARGLAGKNPKTLLHTDAVQGFLKLPFSAKTWGLIFSPCPPTKLAGRRALVHFTSAVASAIPSPCWPEAGRNPASAPGQRPRRKSPGLPRRWNCGKPNWRRRRVMWRPCGTTPKPPSPGFPTSCLWAAAQRPTFWRYPCPAGPAAT